MSHHDVPSDVVVVTPAGKAHRGIRHESGVIETDAACNLSNDTDCNTIVDESEFKGDVKKDADLCGRCFPDAPSKAKKDDADKDHERDPMDELKEHVTGADKMDEKDDDDKPRREAASHRKGAAADKEKATPKKSDMDELKEHVTGADKVERKKK